MDGNKETFFDIQKDLAKEIISKLDLSVSNQQISAMEEAGTRSLDAYIDYMKALLFYNSNNDSTKYYLEKSINHDKNFKKPVDLLTGTYFNLLIENYSGYLEGHAGFIRDWEQVNRIEDISIFIEAYNYFNSNIFLMSDYSKWFESKNGLNVTIEFICAIIQYYYCNPSKSSPINGSNLCGEDDNKNALIWVRNRYDALPTSTNCQNYGYLLTHYKNDYESAMNLYLKAIELEPNDFNMYYSLLLVLQKMGNKDDYLKYGKMALNLDRDISSPNIAPVLTVMADTYYEMGDDVSAIDYYRKSLDFIEDEMWKESVQVRIGMCYFFQKDYKMAIENFLDDGLDLNMLSGKPVWYLNTMANNYHYLSYSYYLLESYEKAISYQELTIDMITNHTLSGYSLEENYSNLAEFYKKNKNYSKMYESLIAARDFNPEYWLVRNNLSEYYMITKNYEKALEEIEKAISLAPDNPAPFDTMGDLQLEIGNIDNALNFYFKSIQVDSTFAKAFYHIAAVYEKQEHPDFIEYYQKASELGNSEAELWVLKNKRLINDQKSKKSKPAASNNYIEELKKLAELKSLGIITEEEFEAKKKELLGL